MTHPISAQPFLAADREMPAHNAERSLQISLIAIGILTTLFSLMIMPWQAALPANLLLWGFCLILCSGRSSDAEWVEPPPVVIAHRHAPEVVFMPPEPRTVIIDRPRAPEVVYMPPEPRTVIVDDRPRAPVGVRLPAAERTFVDTRPHAPVGHRNTAPHFEMPRAPVVSGGSIPSTSGGYPLSAPRAPVGRR
jgi:hypothetical protein